MVDDLDNVSSIKLLECLAKRGGHPGALAKAALLCARKSNDYNGPDIDMHSVDRTAYFPFGAVSYAQMLHTKSARFVALSRGVEPNFEGLEDTALDLINYAGFYIAHYGEVKK